MGKFHQNGFPRLARPGMRQPEGVFLPVLIYLVESGCPKRRHSFILYATGGMINRCAPQLGRKYSKTELLGQPCLIIG
jgi:hypothetical protein